MEDQPSLVGATTVVRQSLDTSEQSGFSEEKRAANLTNSSCQTSQYRLADVAFFLAGDRQVLAYARDLATRCRSVL